MERKKLPLSKKEQFESLKWLKTTVNRLRTESEFVILGKQPNYLHTNIPRSIKDAIGHFWLYVYDPKLKNDNKRLPYYDRFPLILLIGFIGHKYMIGLNFHYLPLKQREILMRKFMPLRVNVPKKAKQDRDELGRFIKGNQYQLISNEDDKKIRLKISYELLKLYKSRAPEWVPCFKKYIIKRIKSKALRIPSSQWNYVLSLPLDRFKKRTNRTVWRHSLESIKNVRNQLAEEE